MKQLPTSTVSGSVRFGGSLFAMRGTPMMPPSVTTHKVSWKSARVSGLRGDARISDNFFGEHHLKGEIRLMRASCRFIVIGTRKIHAQESSGGKCLSIRIVVTRHVCFAARVLLRNTFSTFGYENVSNLTNFDSGTSTSTPINGTTQRVPEDVPKSDVHQCKETGGDQSVLPKILCERDGKVVARGRKNFDTP
jgi:hypothetical protein